MNERERVPDRHSSGSKNLTLGVTLAVAMALAACGREDSRASTPSVSPELTVPTPVTTPVTPEAQQPSQLEQKEAQQLRVLWQTEFVPGTLGIPVTREETLPPYLPHLSSVLYTEDAIYLTPANTQRFARLGLKDGRVAWDGEFAGTPIVVTEDVIAVLREGEDRIYGFSTHDGSQKWEKVKTQNRLDSPPTVFDGKIYYADHVGNLFYDGQPFFHVGEIDIASGENQIKWKASPEERVLGIEGSGRIYLVAEKWIVVGNSYLYSDTIVLDRASGQLLSPPPENMVSTQEKRRDEALLLAYTNQWSPIKLTDETLFAKPEKGDAIIGINLNSGEQWINDEVYPQRIVATDSQRVYVLAQEGALVAIDAKTGERVWRQEGIEFASNGAVLNGELVFGTGHSLEFINSETGEPARPPVLLKMVPSKILQKGNFIIAEGDRELTVIGTPSSQLGSN